MSTETETLSPQELYEAWPALSAAELVEGFTVLSRTEAEELFWRLDARQQAELIIALPTAEKRIWMRILPPDDAADVIQEAPPEERERLLGLLDETTRKEVSALLAYAEDEAGGLMNPRFARLRPEMRADEAISYLRRQTSEMAENIYYAYVLDAQQKLLGVVSLRELVTAPPDRNVRDLMETDLVTVPEEMDQEKVSELFAEHDLMVLPVVDSEGRMKGIVTVDDIVDVVREEATEDMQKFGAVAALEAPYLEVGFWHMIRKRVGWLAVLFVAESFTATAMTYFEHEIDKAVVLALFVPLIVSSGGNSGSQAATLMVRAMALAEVHLRDWWRVMRRELLTGLMLGFILGVIAVLRVLLWEWGYRTVSGRALYTDHYVLVGLTVACSVMGVVLWGTLVGSMLPFLLRRIGLDPASASAPFVATLVDVTGIVIYFAIASVILRGTLL